jgi:hypothetical protein
LTIKEEEKGPPSIFSLSGSNKILNFSFSSGGLKPKNRHVLSNGTLHFPAYRSDAYRPGRRI